MEVIFINDGSRDGTLKIVKGFAAKDNRVKFISFSRNFGKESAIYAGFEHATGDYIAMLDADLQDPPELLSKMLHAIKNEGYDSAATRRVTRKRAPLFGHFLPIVFIN